MVLVVGFCFAAKKEVISAERKIDNGGQSIDLVLLLLRMMMLIKCVRE